MLQLTTEELGLEAPAKQAAAFDAFFPGAASARGVAPPPRVPPPRRRRRRAGRLPRGGWSKASGDVAQYTCPPALPLVLRGCSTQIGVEGGGYWMGADGRRRSVHHEPSR